MTNRPVGFAHSEQRVRAVRHRSATLTQLIGAVLLIASLVVVASTVRFGIGRQEGGATTQLPMADSHQAISKRSTSRSGAASNSARL
jgi:hypothetical protein